MTMSSNKTAKTAATGATLRPAKGKAPAPSPNTAQTAGATPAVIAKRAAKPAAGKAPAKSTLAPKATVKAHIEAKSAAQGAEILKVARPLKPLKAKAPKAPKLVRDSFTIPADEHARISELKTKLLALGYPVKKSQLIRAGFAALLAMPAAALFGLMQALPEVKLGRKRK